VDLPRVHFGGGFAFTEDSRFSTDGTTGVHRSGTGSFRARSPLRLNVGAGADLPGVRLEADLFASSALAELVRADYDEVRIDTTAGQVAGRTQTRSSAVESVNAVINVGVGAEVFLSESLSILAGLASDVSALPPLDTAPDSRRLFGTRFDAWHAGLGLTAYTDQGEIVFGTRWDYSTGDMLGVNGFATPPDRDRIAAREWAGMVVIAGRVTLSSVQKAAETVSETVSGQAPPPAKDSPDPSAPP
jgi:hypothetical protein